MKRFALFALLASALGIGSAVADTASQAEWQPSGTHEQTAAHDSATTGSTSNDPSRSDARSNDTSSGQHETNHDSGSSHDTSHDGANHN